MALEVFFVDGHHQLNHLRAVTFGFLSSLSIWRGTWQYSHSTPREAAMNCIEGISCSAGMPLSACMFLYSSSASFGATPTPDMDLGGVDCPRASAMPSTASNEVPQTKIQPLERNRFIDPTLAGSVTKLLAKWLQQIQRDIAAV